MVKIYQQPFAHAGTKQVIPDASDPQGFVSNEDGFTTDYELPDTDPNYKPIERAEFNGLMNMITEAVGELQQFGFAKWQPITWPQGANVNHGGGVWQSLADDNTEEPGTGALWKPILFDEVATTAQAQALTADSVALTPAKLAAAFGGANQRLTTNGYQKLPGGLIIQWGKVTSSGNAVYNAKATLPIAFPVAGLVGVGSVQAAGIPQTLTVQVGVTSTAQLPMTTLQGQQIITGIVVNWVAIGY